MNKNRTDEELIPPELEPIFEVLLIQFDEALSCGKIAGQVPRDVAETIPDGLLEELAAMQSCLRLLRQMQVMNGAERGC